MKVVVPRDPVQAKGLLLAEDNVPNDDFTLELEKSEVVREGKDITLIGYGNLMRTLSSAANRLEKEGISCEIIDLQTIYPYDA